MVERFIRKIIEKNKIIVDFTLTTDIAVDPMTKRISKYMFTKYVATCGYALNL